MAQRYGKAYQRNRIKRLLRESYRSLEELELGYNIVILVKKNINILDFNFNCLKKDMLLIFGKARLIRMEEYEKDIIKTN